MSLYQRTLACVRCEYAKIVGFALLLTLLQLAFPLLLARGLTFEDRYFSLFHWDSYWYQSILVSGYSWSQNMGMSNIPFFPGYPMVAAIVRAITGWSAKVSLLFSAELACFGFWTYFLLLLRRWRVDFSLRVICLAMILAFPTSFYMVAAYTESLFLFGIVGTIYWMQSKKSYGAGLATLHACLVALTRFVGIGIVLIPLLSLLTHRTSVVKHLAIAAGGVMGSLLYFTFLQKQFGDFFLFFKAQLLGWGVKANYAAIFSWKYFFLDHWPFPLAEDPWRLSYVLVVLMINMIVFFGVYECCLLMKKKSFTDGMRLGLLGMAASLVYIPVSAMQAKSLFSCSRYMLPVMVILCIYLVRLFQDCHPTLRVKRWSLCIALFFFGASLYFALSFTRLFTAGNWVA